MSTQEKFEKWFEETYGSAFSGALSGAMTGAFREVAEKAWQASRAAALEEAAARIMPSNPPDDWTEYAKIHAEAAEKIRALAKDGAEAT